MFSLVSVSGRGCESYTFFVYVYLWCYVSAPPVPSVHVLTKWNKVYLSEKVKFKCSISNSTEYTFSWSKDGREITASDSNVLLSGDGSLLSMTMVSTHLTGSYTCKALHSATGHWATATNSETLTVLRK